jgi:ribonuclease BN (tRNA processing enzyme)
LFPVRLRDLHSVYLHDVIPGTVEVPGFAVVADLVMHPGPTLGYRVSEDGRSLAYLPDHEPALGSPDLGDPAWISGFSLVVGVDVLIHDAQYSDAEYRAKVGWGHSTYKHTMSLARIAGVASLVTFHHDPDHTDEDLDRLHLEAQEAAGDLKLLAGLAGMVLDV